MERQKGKKTLATGGTSSIQELAERTWKALIDPPAEVFQQAL
ncbi:MAG: hypothetical protein WBB69_11400 [Anaerolineales bacterium]